MNSEEAVALLRKVTYRPGWTIESYTVPTGVVFRAGGPEPDAYYDGEGDPPLVPIVYSWALTADELKHMSRDDLLRWALTIIKRRVEHEVEEWVKCDGVRIVQPHPGRGKSLLGPGSSAPT